MGPFLYTECIVFHIPTPTPYPPPPGVPLACLEPSSTL